MTSSQTLIDSAHRNAFALIEKDGIITRYCGPVIEIDALDDIHNLAEKHKKNIVFVLPYAVIRERGFAAQGDTPILALIVEEEPVSFSRDDFASYTKKIELKDGLAPSLSDDEFAALVEKVQKNEIHGGNISQVNISRIFEGQITDFDLDTAFSLYAQLLKQHGTYMTVMFVHADPDVPENSVYILGATPECHVEINDTETVMTPIAGTLRKEDRETFADRLKKFVEDPKEINELFQVTDEELKMMGRICPQGGVIEGPFLREIGNVVHSEYKLIGKRQDDCIDSLRYTFHAPTVVGSPLESAARVIAKYEAAPRRYYAGEVGIYDYSQRRPGKKFGNLDAAILIRAVEIDGNGVFRVQAGGGLVRDSQPMEEARETRAKASAVTNILDGTADTGGPYLTEALHHEIRPTLLKRNADLSRFWFSQQSGSVVLPELLNTRITIINNEDDFAHMLGHIIRRYGAVVEVQDTHAFDVDKDKSDIVLIGPGPGDVSDMANPRMVRLDMIVTTLMAENRNILGVCLGHQALCRYLGFAVVKQPEPSQGLQRMIDIDGKTQRLAFYNSFSPQHDPDLARQLNAAVNADGEGRIMTLRRGNITGFQFHPESIMSQYGDHLLARELARLKSA